MSEHKPGAVWWLALVALELAGCPRRELTFGPRGEIRDPQELLAALAARSSKLHRLRSEVAFKADGAGGRGSTRGLVAAQRPALLHLELDDFFGNPAATLTSDGATLGVYQASSNIFATGAASPENVARVVPIVIPIGDAVDLVLSDPRPVGTEVRGFFVDRGRYAYAVQFEAGVGPRLRRQRIDFDTETLVPSGETMEGYAPFSARFLDVEADSGLRVARRLEVESPGGKLTLVLKNLEVNPLLPPDLFVPRAPPGAEQRLLESER